MIETSEDEVRGINTKAQLAEAEAVMQARLRKAALDAGVTMIAPDTVYLAADTTFGNDVTIEPFVVIGPGVTIADGAVIHSFSHIVQAAIGKNASVGPYARLRPGTSLGEGARIGNFVETKAAMLEAGVKVNHLTYIGDAHVGANANIGAGTITCNYDGFNKHKTTIGAGAFVGSNSSLVAPVKIGNGAYIGSGSVITKDVPDDALAVERSPQTNREGGAKRYREMKMRAKKAEGKLRVRGDTSSLHVIASASEAIHRAAKERMDCFVPFFFFSIFSGRGLNLSKDPLFCPIFKNPTTGTGTTRWGGAGGHPTPGGTGREGFFGLFNFGCWEKDNHSA